MNKANRNSWIVRYQDGQMLSVVGTIDQARRKAEEKRPGIKFVIA